MTTVNKEPGKPAIDWREIPIGRFYTAEFTGVEYAMVNIRLVNGSSVPVFIAGGAGNSPVGEVLVENNFSQIKITGIFKDATLSLRNKL